MLQRTGNEQKGAGVAKGNIRLADVAKAAGVSQGTASNVFSRPELVREEVREHVKGTAEKMGYKGPDPIGRLLRAGKVNAIGVAAVEPLSYFFDDHYARALMAAISQACDARGAGISLVSAINEERLAWNIKSALVDGFILLCIEGGERLVQLTRDRQLPFVALALGVDDRTIPALGIDNVAGAAMAGRHLGGLGHKRLAILATPFVDRRHGPIKREELTGAIYSTSRDRVTGYLAGLAEFGIEGADVPIYETESQEPSILAGLEYLFGQPNPPTGLLAMSDRIALAAMEWLKARGLRVPDDVSVVGFDGVPEGALSDPPLTTVTQPIAELGQRAVKAILDYDGATRRETLPLQWTQRGSTAAPNR
jgi:DNA-binding LacI/PurR family transcriptional regulator